MIVLDEQIDRRSIATGVAAWYSGRVVSIKHLRPRTVIKDDSIELLLRAVRSPAFVTINLRDFWQVMHASPRYCVICIDLPQSQAEEIPALLRRLCTLSRFRTRALRMGTVICVRPTRIEYYQAERTLVTTAW
ncbi:MAG: hypothetical protein HZB53_01825 [Chloroflexi bacterium]|nr:hypothetical protein [Chloroflexota bacterium]